MGWSLISQYDDVDSWMLVTDDVASWGSQAEWSGTVGDFTPVLRMVVCTI